VKKILSVWKTGFITVVPVLVIIIIMASILNWASNIGAVFTDSKTMIWLITAAALLGVPIIFGWLLSCKWVRTFGLEILGKLPVVGSLFSFFLNHDYIERIKSGDLQEVMFKYAGSTWTIGGVVNKFTAPIYGHHGHLVTWCVVLGPPTAPLAPTAPVLLVKEADLIYTGRTYKDTLLTVASFGFNADMSSLLKKYKEHIIFNNPAN